MRFTMLNSEHISQWTTWCLLSAVSVWLPVETAVHSNRWPMCDKSCHLFKRHLRWMQRKMARSGKRASFWPGVPVANVLVNYWAQRCENNTQQSSEFITSHTLQGSWTVRHTVTWTHRWSCRVLSKLSAPRPPRMWGSLPWMSGRHREGLWGAAVTFKILRCVRGGAWQPLQVLRGRRIRGGSSLTLHASRPCPPHPSWASHKYKGSRSGGNLSRLSF